MISLPSRFLRSCCLSVLSSRHTEPTACSHTSGIPTTMLENSACNRGCSCGRFRYMFCARSADAGKIAIRFLLSLIISALYRPLFYIFCRSARKSFFCACPRQAASPSSYHRSVISHSDGHSIFKLHERNLLTNQLGTFFVNNKENLKIPLTNQLGTFFAFERKKL